MQDKKPSLIEANKRFEEEHQVAGRVVFGPANSIEEARRMRDFKVSEEIDKHELLREMTAQEKRDVELRGGGKDNAKDTNPKDAVGCKKVYFSTIPVPVLAEVGLGMLEGALKYGRHNYRKVGVRASVYYDAFKRHIEDWWEGEDIDPDSDLSHITKAICTLVVLRDAMIQNKLTDDRPPKSPKGWMRDLNKRAAALIEKYPNPVAAVTELNKED